jgi:hypothetical protein
MTKQRKLARRNPAARDLQSPLYRKRIERDRKRALKAGYLKHPTKEYR